MTRVSESANSPWARPTCSDPAVPAEVRSDRRWRTAMFETPLDRDNFQLDWSQRATPRLARMAQASSTTTTTPDEWGSANPVTAAWNQAVAHVMRTTRAAAWETADRSRTTRGPSRLIPGEVTSSNMP